MTIPAIRSFPYDSVGGDAGPYDSEYFALIQQAHLGSYTRRTTASVLLGTGNGSQESLLVEETSPQSLGVTVREGWAMVNNRTVQVSVDTTVTIVQNNDPSLDDRIDSIVLRTDKSTPIATLVAKQGTVAPAPVPPSLTQNATVWEVRIADVTVPNGASNITTADIDNSVRVYARQTLVKEGGTGLATIALGQLMAGSAVNTMAAVAAAIDYGKLIGDSAQATDMKWVSQRISRLRANNTTSFSLSPTLVPFASADWVNPVSYITYLTANQFRLEAGVYRVMGHMLIATSGAGANRANFFIADAAAPTVPLTYSVVTNLPNSDFGEIAMMPQELVSDGSQLFECYVERSVAGGTTQLQSGVVAGLTASGWGQELVFERMK